MILVRVGYVLRLFFFNDNNNYYYYYCDLMCNYF